MAYQIDCPSCGADVRVKKGAVSAVCSYCGSSVVIPEELRGEPVYRRSSTASGKGCGAGTVVIAALAGLLVVGGAALTFFFAANGSEDSVKGALSAAHGVDPELEFGGTGSGRGHFQDAECIAADGMGHVYVGEWESGRIQVFDDGGNFLNQWSYAPPGEFYLSAMSSSRTGNLYLVYDSEIYIHDGQTGEVLGNLTHPEGWGFEDVDVSAGDGILASWYCNRDDLVFFNQQGGIEVLLRNAVSGVTGDSELSMTVAAGNTGEMYVYGSFNTVVLAFDSQGAFTDRFGSDDLFTMPSGMDVDNRGRLWISDFGDLMVFSSTGELISTIDPGAGIQDFVIDDEDRLWGVTGDDTVVMLDISQE